MSARPPTQLFLSTHWLDLNIDLLGRLGVCYAIEVYQDLPALHIWGKQGHVHAPKLNTRTMWCLDISCLGLKACNIVDNAERVEQVVGSNGALPRQSP